MLVDIAFFKADKGEFDDKFINRFSGEVGFSHCEFIVTPNHMIGSHYKHNGVNDFYYNNIYQNPDWEILRIPDANFSTALYTAHSLLGTPYDTLGVLLYFAHIKCCDSKRGMWCSEFVAHVVNTATKSNMEELIMPNDLYTELLDKYRAYPLDTLASSSRLLTKTLDVYGRVKYGTN